MEAEELSRRVEEILVPLRAGNREEGLRLLGILEEELNLNTDRKREKSECAGGMKPGFRKMVRTKRLEEEGSSLGKVGGITFEDDRSRTQEERTEAADDFLTKGQDSDTIRAVVVLTNEISTLRACVKEQEKEECAKCHVEDSEFCDEVNVALADLEKKRARLEFLESVGKESDGWCEHERRYQRTSGGDGDHCYVCEVDGLRAHVERLKTELAAVLLKEGEAFRLGEKAVLGLMEERDAIQARLKTAGEANKNLMEEHQALVRNAAVERKELRAEIEGLKAAEKPEGKPVIEMCELDHKFAELPDHPKRNGLSRCPHCMAIGLDRLRKEKETEGLDNGMGD